MNATTKKRVTQNIKNALTRFVNARERALRDISNNYHTDITTDQAKAISAIRSQMAFKSNWSMNGQCRMVVGLETQINTLLPSEYTHRKQQGVRTAIIDLLTYAKREVA